MQTSLPRVNQAMLGLRDQSSNAVDYLQSDATKRNLSVSTSKGDLESRVDMAFNCTRESVSYSIERESSIPNLVLMYILGKRIRQGSLQIKKNIPENNISEF